MRIKINDKIYRLKEIESGVDSLMELVEEPQYKDGDFVVNMKGCILIFKKKENMIYNHAYFIKMSGEIYLNYNPTTAQIERYATEEEKQELLGALAKGGKRWNADKKCIEDIPVRKFKKGDKVRIKEGISSKTHRHIFPYFMGGMDELIEKELTVDVCTNGIVCVEESGYNLHEDWLEPYEELKKGDLAIFWDLDKSFAFIGKYNGLLVNGSPCPHQDSRGYVWKNAIKFESKEQYEKLLKGEI